MISGMPRFAIAVRDFPSVVSVFREQLGMPVVDLSADSIGSLGAALAVCVPEGGSNIEIMSPGNPEAPLSQSVQRFLDRRGEGHFALMLEAADPDLEAEGLSRRGLNVLPRMEGAGGRDVHPNSTHGVLIRVYPTDSFTGRDPDHIEGPNPPGLSGIERVLVAVRDLAAAVASYGEKFALEVREPVEDRERGVRSAICTPPSGGEIELLAVRDSDCVFARSIEQFLEAKGEGAYALVLQSRNLQQTADALAARGVDVSEVEGLESILEIDRSVTCGARFWIECST
jgi:catechol 2,3-dioxygenase-like lactoylglutathione lyase family enzyme